MKKTVGNYEIIDKIGAGAMSRVYLACPRSLPDKRVAIKVLDPALAMDDEFVARFKREAQAVSFLQHGNVANIFDFGVDGDVHYIAMEYLKGSDLRKIMDEAAEIRETPGLPVGLVIYLIEEMAHGLRSAHERGIIHRDIKPTNVLLGLEGEVKVVDFGLARSLDESSSLPMTEATMSGAFLGTAAYASPEQAAKQKDLDARSDVFSLGVLAYEMLTNRKPFMSRDLDSTLRMIIEEPHMPLAESPCSPVFPELVTLIDGMLAKRRDDRLPDMAAVLDALEACRQGLERRGIRYSNRRHHLALLAADPQGYCRTLHAEVAASFAGDAGPARPVPDAAPVGEQTIVPSVSPQGGVDATIVPQGETATDPEPPRESSSVPPRPTAEPATAPEPVVSRESGTPPAEPAPPPAAHPGSKKRWPWLAGLGVLVLVGAVAAYVIGVGPFTAGTSANHGWLSATASMEGVTLRYAKDDGGGGGYPLDQSGVKTASLGPRASVLELETGNWFGEAARDGYSAHGQNWAITTGETLAVRFEPRPSGVAQASLYIYTAPSRFDGASVFIDGELMSEKTPAFYRDLAPGDHVVRVAVELDGVTYKKELEVVLLPGVEDRRVVRFDE